VQGPVAGGQAFEHPASPPGLAPLAVAALRAQGRDVLSQGYTSKHSGCTREGGLSASAENAGTLEGILCGAVHTLSGGAGRSRLRHLSVGASHLVVLFAELVGGGALGAAGGHRL
jgi:hypothetical protein